LRQLRNNNILSVNALLVITLGTYVSLRPPDLNLAAAMILLGALCVPVCWVWSRIQLRNAEYIRFRRSQLLSIEKRLPGLSTFQNTWSAFYKNETVRFIGNGDSSTVSKGAAKSSTRAENGMLLFILGFWVAILTAGVLLLALTLL